MSDVLSALDPRDFVDFVRLFRAEEGRLGVTITFVAILELLREGLIEIQQSSMYGPLHVRRGAGQAAAPDAAANADNDEIMGSQQ